VVANRGSALAWLLRSKVHKRQAIATSWHSFCAVAPPTASLVTVLARLLRRPNKPNKPKPPAFANISQKLEVLYTILILLTIALIQF
ncbi:MAG: hypothetical protein RR918_07695, partial [Anaerovoracaceae bacterium]